MVRGRVPPLSVIAVVPRVFAFVSVFVSMFVPVLCFAKLFRFTPVRLSAE